MTTLEDKLSDGVSQKLLAGSLRVAGDAGNPIRMHLFAAGIRELFGHILHSHAPDEEVQACSWFVQAKDTKTITRRQRAAYAAQGGLSDEYLVEIGVEIEELHRRAIKAIDRLNGVTHIAHGKIEESQLVIDSFKDEVLVALEGLVDSFYECRKIVCNRLEESVYDVLRTTLISETFETIDSLAGKGYEIDSFIEDEAMEVESITFEQITVKFGGGAPVTLHYGSRDDAAEVSHTFPFWMRFVAPVNDPSDLTLKDYFFDDTSWYE